MTIYNTIYPENPIKNGIIEIINLYDYYYHLLVVDGEIIDELGEDYKEVVVTPSFIKKMMKKSGVDSSQLYLLYYDFEKFAHQVLPVGTYDANDYNYAKIFNLCNQYLTQFKEYVDILDSF